MKPNFPAALLTALLALAAFPPQGRASLPQWYLDAGLPELDTDGDGIPDAWERRTFGNPSVFDSGLDRDRDGLTDLEEFILGTDPRTFSTMGDLWSDGEKVRAGLDPLKRVTPAVAFAQWLSFTGWDAQTWRMQTATNGAGFAVSYAGFVYNTSPYSETNPRATVDFWLAARTDRPALLTVADALSTNSFPVPSGNRRVRLRVAYGGEVALTLNPLPGTLAELPGATNGVWLCKLTVEPAEPDTVVFASGETPPPVAGDPPGVNGILIQSQPASPFPQLGAAAPRVSLLPLRMTADGLVTLGDGGWYCLGVSDPPCAWPTYGMIGCDAASMGMCGATGDTPILSREDAQTIFDARQPRLRCTVTQTVANAAYPFLYGKVVFTVGACEATGSGDVLGAEWDYPGHEPGHYNHTYCSAIGCICVGGPRTFVGFDHASVNTCFTDRHPEESAEDKRYHHCLGIIWINGATNLTSLCKDFGQDLNSLVVWEVNGTRQSSSMLDLGTEPPDLEPAIYRIKMLQASNPDIVWDRLILVVNNSTTKELFTDWYDRFSVETNWLAELPAAYNNTFGTTTNWLGVINTQAHPEPNGDSVFWETRDEPGKFFHHTSKWEMRSVRTAGKHGHQACYNVVGVVVTTGVSAGSADFGHWKNFYRGGPSHVEYDVEPFVRALQLDGNPCKRINLKHLDHAIIYQGANIDKYLRCRPANPNNRGFLNPGQSQP